MLRNLGRSLKIQQKFIENGEYWGERVFYCLMLRNLGRRLRNKTKIKVKWGILRGKGVLLLKYWELGENFKE